MPIIYCETRPIKPNIFEFTHSYYVGLAPMHEEIFPYEVEENDRLRAAIINVGLACRAIADKDGQSETILHKRPHNAVAIVSDHDGKNILYKNEHDALYSLLCPSTSDIARKHISLFGEYQRYLGRIQDLRRCYNIKIVLAPRGKLVTYSGRVIENGI